MAKRKKPVNALAILRERERKRRLVPPVVIQRRKQLRRVEQDPAYEILGQAKRYSARHANAMHDLMLRIMGLNQLPETVSRRFMREGLDDVKMDSRAVSLMGNAINKISEILIFKMVAQELVNDPVLQQKMVDLFIDQRFEVMRHRPKEDGDKAKTPSLPAPDPYKEERDKLVDLLKVLTAG